MGAVLVGFLWAFFLCRGCSVVLQTVQGCLSESLPWGSWGVHGGWFCECITKCLSQAWAGSFAKAGCKKARYQSPLALSLSRALGQGLPWWMLDFTQCVNDDGVGCCLRIHLLKIYSARTSSREKRGGRNKSGIFTLYPAYQQLPHAFFPPLLFVILLRFHE